MDTAGKTKSKYSLLTSFKSVSERVLSYPGNLEIGLAPFVEQLEYIFCDELDQKQTESGDHDKGFPGLLLCLQWCILHLKSHNASKVLGNDVEKDLENCKNPEEFFETFQKLCLIGSIVDCIILYIKDKWFESCYNSEAFLNDRSCVSAFIACLKAYAQRSPKFIAGVPLCCIENEYSVSKHQAKPFSRIHSVDQSALYEKTVSKRRGNSLENPSPGGIHSSLLPDVVACTKKSLCEDLKIGLRNPEVQNEEKSDLSLTHSEYSEEPGLRETEVGAVTSDVQDSADDYMGEDAQLHLSELLIAVIQGRKCGLSRPDLLDSSNDNRVPDDMKGYGYSEGESLHKIAFSIEDSLCQDGSSASDLETSNVCDVGTNTDNELDSMSSDTEGVVPAENILDWCVSANDVPQSLLPLPKILPIESHDDTDSLSGSCASLVFDSFSHTQPGLHLVFQVRKDRSRSHIMAEQKYKCSGCGTHVEKSAAKKFRYCEYFGEYFCSGCHDGKSLRVIPVHIFHDFNFKRYKVSKSAGALLEEIHHEPIFNIMEVNGTLYSKSKSLCNSTDLRQRGSNLLKRLENCSVVWDSNDLLVQVLHDLPPHILRSDPHLYSVQDMIDVRSKKLEKQLQYFIEMCYIHIKNCDFCSSDNLP